MVNFNFFKRKKKATGAETPVYRSILTPPMPTIKVPVNENPDTRPTPPPNPFAKKKNELDPPFDAEIANKISTRFVDKKAVEMEEILWNKIKEKADKGQKSILLFFDNEYHSSISDKEEELGNILSSLDSRAYEVIWKICKKFVKYNYTVELENKRTPRFYIEEGDATEKLHPYEHGTPRYVKKFSIEIRWEDDARENPCLEYTYVDKLIQHKRGDEVYYTCKRGKEITTKEQIIAEEEAECQETS